VKNILQEQGWQISNIDATIIVEEPRLASYITRMKQQISQTLDISKNKISIKASTSDRLGIVGQGDAVAAVAIVMVG